MLPRNQARKCERVAATPAFSENQSAYLTAGSSQATVNQCVVKLWMGQLCTFERSKAKRTIVAIGKKRKRSTPITHKTRTPSPAALHLHRLECAQSPCPEKVEDHDHDRHDGQVAQRGGYLPGRCCRI